MVRLRKLGSEFYSPDDFKENAQITMPYLADFAAYQDYLDGDLDPLFERKKGNTYAQDVTGARYYEPSGTVGYYKINLFRSVTRYTQAAIWERNPTVLDTDDEELQNLWKEISPALIRQARKATEWLPAKGRAVLAIERRYPDVPVPTAIDPHFYFPIVDRINRDLKLGHGLVRFWYDGDRLVDQNRPNRATVEIYIDKEMAAMSDGRLQETNDRMDFYWNGLDVGVIGSAINGKLGANISTKKNVRLDGIWTIGDDDSLFATMEDGVYEAILAISHARTALTQEVRATQVVPDISDVNYTDPVTEDEKIKRLLHPQFSAQTDDTSGGAIFGFQDGPGPMMSDSFLRLYETALNNLAYSANIPPEAFGLNAMPNEPAEMFNQIQRVFATYVGDIRADLSVILSEMFGIITGRTGVEIGWELEVFGDERANDDRAVKLKGAGIISNTTAQRMTNTPIEEINDGINQRSEGGAPANLNGRDDSEPSGVEERQSGNTDVQQGE